ncbi:hypothetical protein E0H75_42200 [Kribbella capetownensis]|uniref:Peptidase inhibitor family I36 n=1 Tax=Kribbella capetownensis TaxID=1572659 RepID=A0A4R0IK52_9ACTN|nr:hypothetical protein [Kribbella capetownensis]TCC33873.1 hypothetical protein E0H75_42200 [Kribbella capetownensis]
MLGVVLAIGSFTSATAVATVGSAVTGTTAISGSPLSDTEVRELIAKPGPRTFTVDVHTGKVLSVNEGPIMQPAISTTNSCKASDGCWRANPPNYNQGFYGQPGTISGSWANRTGYYTGAYWASACWQDGLYVRCSPYVFQPNTLVNLSRVSTGRSFTIDHLG